MTSTDLLDGFASVYVIGNQMTISSKRPNSNDNASCIIVYGAPVLAINNDFFDLIQHKLHVDGVFEVFVDNLAGCTQIESDHNLTIEVYADKMALKGTYERVQARVAELDVSNAEINKLVVVDIRKVSIADAPCVREVVFDDVNNCTIDFAGWTSLEQISAFTEGQCTQFTSLDGCGLRMPASLLELSMMRIVGSEIIDLSDATDLVAVEISCISGQQKVDFGSSTFYDLETVCLEHVVCELRANIPNITLLELDGWFSGVDLCGANMIQRLSLRGRKPFKIIGWSSVAPAVQSVEIEGTVTQLDMSECEQLEHIKADLTKVTGLANAKPGFQAEMFLFDKTSRYLDMAQLRSADSVHVVYSPSPMCFLNCIGLSKLAAVRSVSLTGVEGEAVSFDDDRLVELHLHACAFGVVHIDSASLTDLTITNCSTASPTITAPALKRSVIEV